MVAQLQEEGLVKLGVRDVFKVSHEMACLSIMQDRLMMWEIACLIGGIYFNGRGQVPGALARFERPLVCNVRGLTACFDMIWTGRDDPNTVRDNCVAQLFKALPLVPDTNQKDHREKLQVMRSLIGLTTALVGYGNVEYIYTVFGDFRATFILDLLLDLERSIEYMRPKQLFTTTFEVPVQW